MRFKQSSPFLKISKRRIEVIFNLRSISIGRFERKKERSLIFNHIDNEEVFVQRFLEEENRLQVYYKTFRRIKFETSMRFKQSFPFLKISKRRIEAIFNLRSISISRKAGSRERKRDLWSLIFNRNGEIFVARFLDTRARRGRQISCRVKFEISNNPILLFFENLEEDKGIRIIDI